MNIQACAEAVVFLEKWGVDLKAALDVLNGGLAGSTVLTRKKDNFLNRDFKPGFRIDLHHKDMGIVTDAARNVGAALPVGATVAQLVASLRAQGDGGLDHSAPAAGRGAPVRRPGLTAGTSRDLRVAPSLTPVLSRPSGDATRNPLQQTVDVHVTRT